MRSQHTVPLRTLGALLPALKDSYEVEDTDLGHVFAGLEAMCCPRYDPGTTPTEWHIFWRRKGV
jgi:hypothetical protein